MPLKGRSNLATVFGIYRDGLGGLAWSRCGMSAVFDGRGRTSGNVVRCFGRQERLHHRISRDRVRHADRVAGRVRGVRQQDMEAGQLRQGCVELLRAHAAALLLQDDLLQGGFGGHALGMVLQRTMRSPIHRIQFVAIELPRLL